MGRTLPLNLVILLLDDGGREGGQPGAEDLKPDCITLSKSVKGNGNIIELLTGCFSIYIGLPHMHDLSSQNILGG